MSFLKTVLTYNSPSQAEVDQAFLESHGITVCLLGANTARNEIGSPFFIQLQVPEDQHSSATQLLKEANPERFGSAAKVSEIDSQLKRLAIRFVVVAIPAAILGFLVIPAPVPSPYDEIVAGVAGPRPDERVPGAIGIGVLAGVATLVLRKDKTKK